MQKFFQVEALMTLIVLPYSDLGIAKKIISGRSETKIIEGFGSSENIDKRIEEFKRTARFR